MDVQNSSGGAGIFPTFRQSINRDGEEMNSVTNNQTSEWVWYEKAFVQQDIPNQPTKIDAAQCNENIIFSLFFQQASNIERDQIVPGGS